jgi:RimJ/RimL family protein N-acetyltransferase
MYEEAAPPLEGELVRLRAYEPADAATLNPLFIDPDVLAGVASIPFGQPAAGFREFVEAHATDGAMLSLAIETLVDRTPVGGCGLMEIQPPTRRALLGIWIGKPYWGRGYGSDATHVLCRFGFRYMNLRRIELNVFAWNAAAIRAYEKAGFRIEGTRRGDGFVKGAYVDSHMMGLLCDELTQPGAGQRAGTTGAASAPSPG